MLLIASVRIAATIPFSVLAYRIKGAYNLWQLLLVLFATLVNFQLIAGNVEISSHIRKCCRSGMRYARKSGLCKDYDFEVDAIPPLWRGLCMSTFGVCCSRDVQQQHCVAGRLAALTGSRCDEKFNTSSYSDCCRFCQESYNICCGGGETGDGGATSKRHKDTYAIDYGDSSENSEEKIGGPSVEMGTGDGTIVLKEDDDDICGKVPNLCSHICVNTQEAYVCNCYPGYRLDENGVTCSVDSTVQNGSPKNEKANTSDQDGKYDLESEQDLNGTDSLEDISDYAGDVLCPSGYERKGNKCVDIDECVEKLSKCRTYQYCHNTNGSYRCLNVSSSACPAGFTLSGETNSCEDINECVEGLDDCEPDQQCQNVKGSFNCLTKAIVPGVSSTSVGGRNKQGGHLNRCGSGFEFKNGRCIDINECLVDEATCDSSQICTNDIGGYHCDCKIGFNLDTITNACVDINECSINNHNCLPTQRCDNTLGSYICTRLQSCGTGYTFNAQTNNCDDDDECALNTHTCTADYVCHNTMGSFRCRHIRHSISTTTTTSSTTTTTTTRVPFTTTTVLYSNRSYVYPSSVMSHQTHSQNHVNENVPVHVSSDDRYLSCGVGFHRNHLGACVDTNECLIGLPCGSHQRCVNTNGSYRCQNLLQCGAGYKSTPDGTTCVDIDECETGENNCAANQICRNRKGGYICSCPPGHQLSRLPNGLSRCIDINECEQEHPSVCPSNAYCMNTIGSYYCECKSGFQKSTENDRICLDVDECQEIPGLCHQKCVNFWGGYRCTCNVGYDLSADNRTCNDLDECEVHKSYRLCMGFCNNVPGSYECSCPRGYTLASDKNTCRDIDECSSGDFCTGRHDICTNIRGSYKCTTIHCPFGYVNDPDQKNRCRQISNICEGDDCYNKPSAYTYNFITLVSKLQIPPEGRTIFSLHGPLWYDNIDFDLKIIKIQAAANIEKATESHFEINKSRHEVHLRLKRSMEGPQDIELELSMTVFTNGMPRGKSVAKIFIIVSQYTF